MAAADDGVDMFEYEKDPQPDDHAVWLAYRKQKKNNLTLGYPDNVGTPIISSV